MKYPLLRVVERDLQRDPVIGRDPQLEDLLRFLRPFRRLREALQRSLEELAAEDRRADSVRLDFPDDPPTLTDPP